MAINLTRDAPARAPKAVFSGALVRGAQLLAGPTASVERFGPLDVTPREEIDLEILSTAVSPWCLSETSIALRPDSLGLDLLITEGFRAVDLSQTLVCFDWPEPSASLDYVQLPELDAICVGPSNSALSYVEFVSSERRKEVPLQVDWPAHVSFAAFGGRTAGGADYRPLYEDAYGRLGHTTAPHGTPTARRAAYTFWSREGSRGAEWLVERIRCETDTQTLADVREALVACGRNAVLPILDALDGTLSTAQAETLLEALRHLDTADDFKRRLKRMVLLYRVHMNVDVRLAALKVAAKLGGDMARPLWVAALRDENNPEVREELEALLAESSPA